MHANPHVPLAQVAVAPEGALQARPHIPQWLRVFNGCSQPFGSIPSQFPKPALQVITPHAPSRHTAVALARAQPRPHIPQCGSVVRRSTSQPSMGLALQSP
jgi:hypothetical protein